MQSLQLIRVLRMIFGSRPIDVRAIEKMGLLAVKIGQTFALRADFLDADRCKELSALYRSTVPLPAEDVRALLRAGANEAFHREVVDLDPSPLASASVGQVHRARLKDGTKVAVKVLKRDASESFRSETRSAQRLLKFILFFYPLLRDVADPEGILAYIRETTLDELDLTVEIRHGNILRDLQRRNAASFDLSKLRFPAIHENLSNEQVLVSELLEAPSIDELLEKDALPYDTLLDLFRVHGFFIFCVGTFHGDLHPGNVLVKKDGTLWFVDTGAIGHVSERMRLGLADFMRHLSADDFEGCARSLNAMAIRGIDGKEFASFREKLLALYEDFPGKTVSEASLTRTMMHTIRLGVRSGMAFERGLYPVIKSLMYLDGMVLRCNPKAVLMRDMRRFIDEFDRAKGVPYTSPAPSNV